jgi:hypothetical protein
MSLRQQGFLVARTKAREVSREAVGNGDCLGQIIAGDGA